MESQPKAAATFEYLAERIHKKPELSDTHAVIQFDILGDPGGQWIVDLTTTPGTIRRGAAASPDCVITMHDDDFAALVNKELDPAAAFMRGKIKVKGNMGLLMKLQGVLT